MVLTSRPPEWESVRAATVEVMNTNSCTLWGEFKKAVAGRLGVPIESLKQWTADMRKVLTTAEAGEDGGKKGGEKSGSSEEAPTNQESEQEDNEAESGPDNESSHDDELCEDGNSKRRSTNKQGPKGKGRADVAGEESEAMKAYKFMARAMNLGGLKQMTEEDAESTLKERLVNAGADFKHVFPSPREIARAKQKTETAKDLEGIDVSNVVEGSRRRGRIASMPGPKTKRRKVRTTLNGNAESSGSDEKAASDGEDDSDVDNDDSASEDEESEAEFE